MPSLLLILMVASFAIAIDHYVPLSASNRVTRVGDGYGNPAIRTGATAYPRQAIDSNDFVVRVVRPARRIVSQYWSIDEFVYSVVPPEQVVAVSESAYAAAYSNVYQLAQRYHPAIATDPETVLWLNPDLLLVSNSARADFCDLVRSADVAIYREFTTYTTLRQVADTIRLTGYLTGEDQAAEREQASFWNDINQAKARRPSHASHPRILGIGGSFSYGSDTLFDDVVQTLGGVNVGAQGGLKGYAQVSSEQVVRWNPEWIVAGADRGSTRQVLAHLMTDPALAATKAAHDGHIIVLEKHIFQPMSPFTRLFVKALAEALYG